MNHHEETAREHKKLLDRLELAKQFKEKKRKHWKANPSSDKARFDFQDAIGLVYRLEKQLWQFQ